MIVTEKRFCGICGRKLTLECTPYGFDQHTGQPLWKYKWTCPGAYWFTRGWHSVIVMATTDIPERGDMK